MIKKVKLNIKKKKVKSKGIGSRFERDIAKILSLHWTEDERNDIFIRSKNSGAVATTSRKANKEFKYQEGDITFNDPIGKSLTDYFCIECKKGSDGKRSRNNKTKWDILDIIDGKEEIPVFNGMWTQCYNQAECCNKQSMLIFARNNKHTCIAIEDIIYNKIVNLYGHYKHDIISINGLKIMNFKLFLDWCNLRGFIENEQEKKEKDQINKSCKNKAKAKM